jgi:hypothetical protein
LSAEPATGAIVYSNAAPAEPLTATIFKGFYPSADDPSRAEAVSPIPGKELKGIDIRLRSRPAARLAGKIKFPPDAPPKGEWNVQLISMDAPNWGGRGYGGEIPTDSFEEVAAETGKYIVVASLAGEGKRFRAVQPVELVSGIEQMVTLSLQPAVDITGLVLVEGPGAEKYRHFRVSLASGDGIPDDRRTTRAVTRADLHFTLPNVPPGTWDIDVDPIPEGGFLKAMYLGDQDVLAEDMTIGPKSPTTLKIIIGTQGAKIEGDLDGDPLKDGARATILLAPAGKFSRVLSFFHTKVTDAKGHFTLDGLRPGQYNVFAFEDVAPDAYQDPEFLKPFAKWAQSLELHEGQTSTAKPRMIPVSLMSEAHE